MASQSSLLRAYLQDRYKSGPPTDLGKDAEYQKYQAALDKQRKIAQAQATAKAADAAVAAEKNRSTIDTIKKFGPGAALDAAKQVIVQPAKAIGETVVNTAKLPLNSAALSAGILTGNKQAVSKSGDAYRNSATGSLIGPVAQTATLLGSKLSADQILNDKTLTPEQKGQMLRDIIEPSVNKSGFSLNDSAGQTARKGVQNVAADLSLLPVGAAGGAAVRGVERGITSAQTLARDAQVADLIKQADQASLLGKNSVAADSRIVDESRLLPAEGSPGAQVIGQDRQLGTGAVDPNLAVPVQPADPAITKRLAQVDKKIRSAQVNGGISVDEARSLVQERKSLIQQIQNPSDTVLEPRTNTVAAQVANDTSASISQAIEHPETNLTNIGQQIVNNQSVLSDTIAKQYPHLAPSMQTFTHEVHNQAALTKAAENMVATDPQGAGEVFASGSLAQINPDAHIKLGQQLAYDAAKNGDTAELNRVLGEHQAALTSHAQALRAAGNTNLLSPKAIAVYAAKKADLTGRKIPPGTIDKLEKMATKIDKMPEGPDKIKALAELKTIAENQSLAGKAAKTTGQLLSSFRAVLASTDLSGGGRQGGVLFARFPDIGARAEAAGVKAAFSQKAYDTEIQRLANLTDEQGVPLSQVFERMKLSLQPLKGQTEEQFTGASLAEKTPVAGRIIEGSNRAYDITLSHMRAEAAKRLIDGQGGVEAVSKKWNTAQFRALGRTIDTITGRGRGGKAFEAAAPTLSKTLFSARLWKSRLDLLNPLYYADIAKNPVALKLAIRSGLQFASTVGIVLAAAEAAGAKVETDLRSSDFGKIKIGNTRLDIMGGLQQNLVLAWREYKGQYKSSTTGAITDLNSGEYGSATRLSKAADTVENKLAPVISEIITQIQGKDISGKKLDGAGRLKSLGSNFVPLSIQDQYSAINDSGASGAALAATGLFGAGVGTYGNTGSDWTSNDGKQISQFRDSVGPQKFTKANDEFNKKYDDWLKSVNTNDRFNKLSIADQKTVRTNKKSQLERDVLKKYGFVYKREPTKQLKGF